MDADDVEVFERIEAYRGHARLDCYRLRHRAFAGHWTDPMLREVIERGHAVCVLPYDPVADRVVLIEQFRIGPYAAGGAPWQIEIVAGIVEPGEAAETVARRETMEECGATLGPLEHIATFFASPGIMTETVTLYCGGARAPDLDGIHGLAHEHEDIRSFTVASEEAIGWIGSGRIAFAPAIIVLQWLAQHRSRLRAEWPARLGA